MLACHPGAEGLRVEFDRQCSTERRHDPLTVMDSVNRIVSVRSGRKGGWHGVVGTINVTKENTALHADVTLKGGQCAT